MFLKSANLLLCSNPTIPSIPLMTRIDLHIAACMGTWDLRLNSKTCVESMGFPSFVVFENKGYLTHPAPPPLFCFSCAVQWLKLDFCFYNIFMTLQILLPFWIEFNLQDSTLYVSLILCPVMFSSYYYCSFVTKSQHILNRSLLMNHSFEICIYISFTDPFGNNVH